MKTYGWIFFISLLQFSYQPALLSQNQYLNFDGEDDYIQVENSSTIDYSDNFTIELRFRRHRKSIREDLITKKDLKPGSKSTNDVAIVITEDDKINFFLREEHPQELWLTSQTRINTTDWIHVSCVMSSGLAALYVNGSREGSARFNSNLSSSGPLRIGSNRLNVISPNAGPEFLFDGDIDEVRIWNVARTSSEINEYYNTDLMGDESGLVAYYNFDQGNPCSNNLLINTLLDRASNNNGKLMNFDLTGGLSDPCQSNWNEEDLLSIEENTSNSIQFFPNPILANLTIEFDQSRYIQSIRIYDMLGRLVNSISIDTIASDYQLDLSNLHKGAYMLIISDEKSTLFAKKIIKG